MVGDPREKATAAALADTTSFRTFRRNNPLIRARQMERAFKVETTLHGTTEGAAGDYLCLDSADGGGDEPWILTKDEFEKSYVEHTSD
jgi:hypothetical protein